ncbi:MAG TPA: excinuclease ABC subunit UvrA, partial [Thermomicrobiaceae bacterium]|nr:excinuclease ABC subunit UvrA [Thermomicrobiaceae bacterium]
MAGDNLIIRGAREHNLKNIDVEIPRDKMVVITGLSGSGKSSLAFDTIYAEGQRRYVESLSAYARQFLGLMEKPDVDQIEGLSPAISIDQKSASRNPRSTVGTVTEIYDHLRLLYARIGHPHCPNCGRPITRQSVQQMAEQIQALPDGTRLMILAPLIKDRKGEHKGVLDEVRRNGFARVRVDGEIHDIDDDITLKRYQQHTIEVVVDRLIAGQGDGDPEEAHAARLRMIDSLETALRLGGGIAIGQIIDGDQLLFSEKFACVYCGLSFAELEPRNFSFNSPHGACPDCDGLGTRMEIDPELVVPDRTRSLTQGAIAPWSRSGKDSYAWYTAMLEALAAKYDFSLETPFGELPDKIQHLILDGDGHEKIRVEYRSRSGRKRAYDVHYEGVLPSLRRRYGNTSSDWVRNEVEQYMAAKTCPTCGGARLKPEVRAVTIGGKSIVELAEMSITSALAFVREISDEERAEPVLSARERLIGRQVLKEIRERLSFLVDVGLNYLTLDRGAASLSGGEAQRIRLATQIGSCLMG